MLRPQIFLLILGLIFAVFTVSVVAKPGDSCTTPQGSGKCMKTSECRGKPSGFSVSNYCPNDPEDVKCCVRKECKGSGNICLDKSVSKCGSGAFVRNLCPGGNNIQCCVKDPVTPPPPKPDPKPKCDRWKRNPSKPSEFVLSKEFTKAIKSPAALTDSILGGTPLAPLAGLASWIGFKADECSDKNQCLSCQFIPFSTIPITRCVGNSLCCG